MFLLPSLGIGLALAVVLGGRPGRLALIRFRLSGLVLLALGLQLVLFTRLGTGIPAEIGETLHVGSYVLLIAFALANLHVRPLIPVLLGVTLNAVAIAVNGGHMPISKTAAGAVRDLKETNVSAGAEHLRFLGDVFALPGEIPLANTFSVGDLLIGFGMIAFIVVSSLERGEKTLSPSRIVEPLRIPSYRRLAVGKLISTVGDWLTIAALIGWIYHETGSTGNVAVLLLVRLAPPILGGGLAAVIVDRMRKDRLIVWVEIFRGLAVTVALGGVLSGELLLVFVALACSGGLAAMSNAAVPSLLPGLVPANQLPAANAALGLAKDGAMAVGAVGAGVTLSWLGASAALAVDLATFAVAVTLFSGLRLQQPPLPEVDDAKVHGGGLRYLLSSRPLLFLVLSFGAATLATGLTNASLPRFLDLNMGFGAGGYGFAIAALATGLALGQALVGFTRVGPTAGRWIGVGLILMAGLFVVLGLTDHPPTALLLIGMIGFVDGTTDVLYETVVQREADPRHYGAIFGFSSALITTTMLGAVAAAPLANRLLEPHVVIIGTSVFLVAAGAIALVGMAGTKAPTEPTAEPEPTRVLRPGADLSIVTSTALAQLASTAAEALSQEFSVEIVAAPTLDRWDPEVVLASVEKTSKVVVLHDNSGNESLAAELAATIGERCFEHLDGPVRRAATPDDDLAAVVRDLAEF
ncbi:MAG: MFS transporter [Gaiellaceae bacterium]